MLEATAAPENIKEMEISKFIKEVWQKMTRQTKNFDLKFQDLQNLILKCLNIVSYMGNKLFNNKLENGQQKLKTIF